MFSAVSNGESFEVRSLGVETAPANFWTGPFAFCTLRGVLLRFFLPVLITVGALTACNQGVVARLTGTWEGVSVENVELAYLAPVSGWVKGLRFSFNAGQLTVDIPTELPRKGGYRVVREQGNELTLEIEGPSGKVDRAEFVMDSANSLRWKIGEGRTIRLQRAL
jgi:hypothetical protein